MMPQAAIRWAARRKGEARGPITLISSAPPLPIAPGAHHRDEPGGLLGGRQDRREPPAGQEHDRCARGRVQWEGGAGGARAGALTCCPQCAALPPGRTGVACHGLPCGHPWHSRPLWPCAQARSTSRAACSSTPTASTRCLTGSSPRAFQVGSTALRVQHSWRSAPRRSPPRTSCCSGPERPGPGLPSLLTQPHSPAHRTPSPARKKTAQLVSHLLNNPCRDHQVWADPGRPALRVAGGQHGPPAGARPRGGRGCRALAAADCLVLQAPACGRLAPRWCSFFSTSSSVKQQGSQVHSLQHCCPRWTLPSALAPCRPGRTQSSAAARIRRRWWRRTRRRAASAPASTWATPMATPSRPAPAMVRRAAGDCFFLPTCAG